MLAAAQKTPAMGRLAALAAARQATAPARIPAIVFLRAPPASEIAISGNLTMTKGGGGERSCRASWPHRASWVLP